MCGENSFDATTPPARSRPSNIKRRNAEPLVHKKNTRHKLHKFRARTLAPQRKTHTTAETAKDPHDETHTVMHGLISNVVASNARVESLASCGGYRLRISVCNYCVQCTSEGVRGARVLWQAPYTCGQQQTRVLTFLDRRQFISNDADIWVLLHAQASTNVHNVRS